MEGSVAVTSFSNIDVEAQNGWVRLFANSNTLDIFAQSNATFTTSNDLVLTAKSNASLTTVEGSVVVTSFSNIDVEARNGWVKLFANSNTLDIFAQSNATFTTSNDLVLTANSNATLTTVEGSVAVTSFSNIDAQAQNGWVKLFANSNTLDIFAQSNATFTTSNDLILTANSNATLTTVKGSVAVTSFSNIDMEAQNGWVKLSANSNKLDIFGQSNTTLTSSNMLTLTAKSNATFVTSYGSVQVTSFSNIDAQAQNGWVKLFANSNTMDIWAQSNMTLSSSNDFAVQALSNATFKTLEGSVTVTSFSNINVQAQNGWVKLCANSNTIDIWAQSNLTLSSSNNFAVQALSNATLETLEGSVTVTSFSNIDVQAQYGWVNLFANQNKLNVYAASNMAVSSSNELDVNSTSNMMFNSLAGQINITTQGDIIQLNAVNSNIQMSSGVDIELTARSSNVFTTLTGDTIVNSFSNIFMSAQQGIIQLVAQSNDLNLVSGSNMNMASSNDFNLISQSNVYVTSVAANIIGLASSNIVMTASNDMEFFVARNFSTSVTNTVSTNAEELGTQLRLHHLTMFI